MKTTRQHLPPFLATLFALLALLPATGEPGAGPDIMASGSIGGLKLGTAAEQVAAAVAGVPTKGKDAVWEAIGQAVQEWVYPEAGLAFHMVSDAVGGPKSVLSIKVRHPAKAKTERGIGIGSTKTEVLKAYAAFKSDPEEGFFGDADIHLVGSIYGGMIFTFEDGKVATIFLGAAAE
jgi:hypothetical protein